MLALLVLTLTGAHVQTGNARGVVVCDEPLAAEVGVRILRQGGNAVDAAAAVGLALAVVEPSAGNIGGGGFMLVRLNNGKTSFVDYREEAPASATRNMYMDAHRDPIRGASTDGLRAAGVPGTVAGLAEAQRRFGRLKWRDVVQPAYLLASQGFAASSHLTQGLRGSSDRLTKFAETKRVYLNGGQPPKVGQIVTYPDLASTLARIRDNGPSDFYHGTTAHMIAQDMATRGGLITLKDLASYRVRMRDPLIGTYRGDTIITAPPSSSGGIVLLEMLNLLEPHPAQDAPMGSAEREHLTIEAMKLAFADRAALIGDSDFVHVPTRELISQTYAATRSKLIQPDRDLPSAEIRPGLEQTAESDHTTHFSIVDRDGNAVANTYTLNGGFGSGDMAAGAGFLLNNEMDDFTAQPGHPNMFGLVQGERNAIQPFKRPLSSMTPTIVLRHHKLFLVLGSPGGPTIINTVLDILLNVEDGGMDIAKAVAAPRMHHQWLPDMLTCERGRLSPEVLAALRAMGHRISVGGSQGIANCIEVDPATGLRITAPDPRLPAAAAAER